MASLDDAKDTSGSSPAAMSGTLSPNYMKATTSSSARKGSCQASSKTPPVRVCSYRYCSIHGHQHTPSLALKEFISAKRQLIYNQKEKQLKQDVVHSTSAAKEKQSGQTVSGKTRAFQVSNFTFEEEDGASELSETPSTKSQLTGTQKALNKDLQEPHEIFSICNAVQNGNHHQETRTATSTETVESLIGEGKTRGSSGDYLINILSDKYTEADHIIPPQIVETASLESALQCTQNSSMPTADVDEPCIGDEENTKDGKMKSEADIVTILSDKQKYASMWHLIYQQVTKAEASMSEKWELHEVDEAQQMKYKDSAEMSDTENVQKDEDNESTVLNQSAAIELVQEAINRILQCQEQRFDQPLQYDGAACDNAKELYDATAAAPTEENYLEHVEVNNTIVPIHEQAEERECQRKKLQSHKLKRMFVTAKFIAAMDRLRNIKWREPRFLPMGEAFEEERVNLRHLSINERKNQEEWMLDYALRNVISSMAPIQKRKVALLVEAFEILNLERKGNCFVHHMKVGSSLAIEPKTIDDEQEMVESDGKSMVCDDCCPKTPGETFDLNEDGQSNMDNSILFEKQKVERQSSAEIDTDRNGTDNPSQVFPGVIPDNGMGTPTPMSLGFHDKEAIKLIQDAINELLILPEQANENSSMYTSTTSEETVCNETLVSGRESSSPEEETAPTKTSIDTIATLEGKSKLLKVIMDNKFITEMNKMRLFKLQSPQEFSSTTHLEGEEAPSLRHTCTGEKRSWEKWMLDHVLQQVIEKLSQAQKRRVALLIQAFETVGSQAESTASQKGKAALS